MKRAVLIITLFFINTICIYSIEDSLAKHNSKFRSLDIKRRIGWLFNQIEIKSETNDFNIFPYLKLAEKYIKHFPTEDNYYLLYLNLGKYWKYSNDYSLAAEYYIKALGYVKDKYPIKEAQVYISQGELFRATKSYKKGAEILKKSLEILENDIDTFLLIRAYNRSAALYFEYKGSLPNDSLRECFDYANKALSLLKKYPSDDIMISTLSIMGAAYRLREDYSKSLKHLFQAFDLIEKNYDSVFAKFHYPNVLTNIAITYRDRNQYDSTIYYGKQILDFADKTGIKYGNGYIYNILASVYAQTGDYKEAYYYKDLEYEFSLNEYLNKKNLSILDLQAKYELEDREREYQRNEITRKFFEYIIAGVILFTIIIVIVYSQKTSQLKKKNALINKQNQELTNSNSTKDKLFSIIAHDLKNPIYSIKTMLEYADNNFDELTRDELLDSISLMKNNAAGVSYLLENLLTWSRSQRGTIEYNPIPLQVSFLIQNNISVVSLQAEKKNIKIINELSEDFEIFADVNTLTTVIRNILSNAVKFTPHKGKIAVNAEKKEDYALFSISDTGIGISDNQLENLFSSSSTNIQSGTDDESGTGLGLMICKEFIELNQGKIWAESKLGFGTQFYFTVPIKKNI